jgi:release factor glutamine methyltransferase
MTINQSLNWAIKELKKAKINSAVLDAEALLGLTIKKPKEWILTHPEAELKSQEYKKLIKRRVKHEPVAYIIKTKEFFGLEFFVDKNVLIPRPETELMVEKVLEIIKSEKTKNLIDIGTGSGCIPISILKWIPAFAGMTATAIDYSTKALQVARKNAEKHKVKIKFLKGDLLSPIKKLPNGKIIITANLPYLSDSQYKKLLPEIKKYEPKSALVAGKDGLDYYRKLLTNLSLIILTPPNLPFKKMGRERRGNDIITLLEIDPAQTKKIKKIIKKIFPRAKVEIQKDLAKRDRLVIIKI